MAFQLPIIKGLSQRTAAEKEEAKRNDKASHAQLKELQKLPGNGTCAECSEKYPGWAALPHGVFICIDCAQLHRHIGRHLSQVKAINTGTYLWFPDEIEAMRQMGNRRAASLYLRNHPDGEGATTGPVSRYYKEQHVRNKYEFKKWVATDKDLATVAAPAAVQEVPVAPHSRRTNATSPVAQPSQQQGSTNFFDDFKDWPSMNNPTPQSSQPPLMPVVSAPIAAAPAVNTAFNWATTPAVPQIQVSGNETWNSWGQWESMSGPNATSQGQVRATGSGYDSRKQAIMSLY